MAKVKNKKNSRLADKVQNKKRGEANKNKLNPFEVHINKEKLKVLGKKSKHDRGLPGISRGKAIQKRKETLGTEMKLMHKTNAFIDRRIGEKNNHLSAEDRMIARFAAERAKQHSKKNIYNLADEEVLTHRGQTLEEIEKFDDPRSSDEEDEGKRFGGLDNDFVSEGHFGGGVLSKSDSKDGAKSHKDLIEQLIAESKKRKAEKQKEKEQTLDLTEKLDSEWKDLQPVVFKRQEVEEESLIDKLLSKAEKGQDYDKMMRELKFEKRGTPSDALKSKEKQEEEERKKIEELERLRQERMLPEDEIVEPRIKVTTKHRSADDLDDNFELDDNQEFMLAYDKDGKPLVPEHILKDFSVPNAKKKFEDGVSDTSDDEENESDEESGEEEDNEKDTNDSEISDDDNDNSNKDDEDNDDDESDKDAVSGNNCFDNEVVAESKLGPDANTQAAVSKRRSNESSDNSDEEENKNIDSNDKLNRAKKGRKIKKTTSTTDESDNEKTTIEKIFKDKKNNSDAKSKDKSVKRKKSDSESDSDSNIEESQTDEHIYVNKNEEISNKLPNTLDNKRIKNTDSEFKTKVNDEKRQPFDSNNLKFYSKSESIDKSDIMITNGQDKTKDDDVSESSEDESDSSMDEFKDLRESHESDIEEDSNKLRGSFTEFKSAEGDNLKKLLIGKTPTEQSIALQKLIKSYDPSLSENNKEVLSRLFAHLLQYINDLFSNLSEESDIIKSFLIFDKLVPHFYDLIHINKVSTKKFFVELLKEKHDKFKRKPRRVPDMDTLIFFKLVSILYPTSDFRHPVTTPSLIFMTEILTLSRFRDAHSVSRGLFIVSLILEYTVLSKRLVPSALNFLRGIFYLCANTSVLNPVQVVPPFRLHRDSKILILERDCSKIAAEEKMTSKDLILSEINDSYKIRSFITSARMLREFFDNYSEFEALEAIFEPHIQLLSRVDLDLYPKNVAENVSEILQYIKQSLEVKTYTQMAREKVKPKALRLYEPDIQDVFTGSKNPKLSKEQAEKARLKGRHKKEMKGALREIRRDKAYIASVKIRQKIHSDNIRKEKVKQIYKDASIQQGEINKLKRIK